MFQDIVKDAYDLNIINACRICLDMDNKLYPLVNTQFEDMFLILTGIVPHKVDKRPQFLCTECRHKLKQCHEFRNKCLRADDVLTQMLFNGNELSNETVSIINRASLRLVSNLHRSPINVVSIPYVSIEFTDNKIVKEELTDLEDLPCHYENEDFDSTNFDSEDEVPLTSIRGLNGEEKPEKLKAFTDVRRRNTKVKKGFQEDYAEEIILSKEEQLEELEKRAKSINYIHSPFKCTLCFKGFVDYGAYNNHTLKHDKSSGPYECDICHYRYSNRRQLTTHASTSHSKLYACKACGYRSHTANQARDHEKWHKGFQYECKLCGWKFKKPTTHLTHMRKRHPTEWTCAVCGGSFIGRHGLLMHQTKMHRSHDFKIKQDSKESTSNSPDRYCSECDVLFVSAEAKQRHMIVSLRHTLNNKNSDTCAACGERFPDRASLARHTRHHTRMQHPDQPRDSVKVPAVKKMACDTCGVKFETRSKLQMHIKRMHLGLKYNKNVVCEVCGKKCTSNAALKYHQRTHTGERPYACTYCPKRFSDRNQLRIHLRTHTDERPYSCGLCGKTFRQKPSLNRHTRVHTGAKPYECQYCSKTFSQSNSMKLHVKTIHLKMANKRNKAPKAAADVDVKPDVQNVLTLQQL